MYSVRDENAVRGDGEVIPQRESAGRIDSSFGAFLRARRIELGLSLRGLESRTGIDNARLSRWERDVQRPETTDVLAVLAAALEVEPAVMYRKAASSMNPNLPEIRAYLFMKYGNQVAPRKLHSIADRTERALQKNGAMLDTRAEGAKGRQR